MAWPGGSRQPRPSEEGGPRVPAVTTPEHDVNPVCGHWLGNRCGCYCGEE